jgi:hypothetical protein
MHQPGPSAARIGAGLALLFIGLLVLGCASARAEAPCTFAFADGQEQRVAFDAAFARGLAAVLGGDVPAGAAWALQVNPPRAATALVFITDDRGCLLVSGEVDASLWDAALALIADLAGGDEPASPFPWDPMPGAPQWRLGFQKEITMRTIAVAAAAALILAAPAAGQYGDGPTADWFRSLKVPGSGVSCCDQADCRPARADWRDGAWWVESRITGELVRIPADRVLETPSIFASGVLCEIDKGPGPPELPSLFIYCFAPPAIGF